jgi:hypothetical protein
MNKKEIVFFVILLFVVSFVFSESAVVGNGEGYTKQEICIAWNMKQQGFEISEDIEKYIDPVGCGCARSSSSVLYSKDIILTEFTRSPWGNIAQEYLIPSYGNHYMFSTSKRDQGYYCYTKSPRRTYGTHPDISIYPAGSRWNEFISEPFYEIKYYPQGAKIRECTDDEDSIYFGVSDLEQGEINGINADCGGIGIANQEGRYCENNRCHQCLDDSHCDGFAEFIYLNHDVLNSQCMTTKFYEPDRNICSHCVLLIGSEDAERSITLSGEMGTYFQGIEQVAKGIAEVQPYKYLIEQGKLKITYASSPFDRFVDIEYRQGTPINNKERKILTEKSVEELMTHYSSFCDLDILIFFTYKVDGGGYYGSSNLEFISINPLVNVEWMIASSVHELGHAFGLGDEYYIKDRSKLWESSNMELNGPNVQMDYRGLDIFNCPKWKNRIDEINCWRIFAKLPLNQIISTNPVVDSVKKSTFKSVMNQPTIESRYNIISCEAILNEFGVEGALEMCKQWACEGEVVKQSTTIC